MLTPKDNAEMILAAMKHRIDNTILTENDDPETLVQGVTHIATCDVSILCRRSEEDNASLIHGYSYYFRETLVKLIAEGAKVLGRTDTPPEFIGEAMDGVELMMRRVLESEDMYVGYLSDASTLDDIGRLDKCVIMMMSVVIKGGDMGWVLWTEGHQRNPNNDNNFELVAEIEDYSEVLAELEAKAVQTAEEGPAEPGKQLFVPLLQVDTPTANGTIYPHEVVLGSVNQINEWIGRGVPLYGELVTKEMAEPMLVAQDVSKDMRTDKRKISHVLRRVQVLNNSLIALVEPTDDPNGKMLRNLTPNYQERNPIAADPSDVVSFGIRGFCDVVEENGVKMVKKLDIVSVDAIYDPELHGRQMASAMKAKK